MGCYVHLGETEVRLMNERIVADKECFDLLQKLRSETGKEWIIETRDFVVRRLLQKPHTFTFYGLYLRSHPEAFEYQAINLTTTHGGSVFNLTPESRSNVLNYMCGILDGLELAKAKAA